MGILSDLLSQYLSDWDIYPTNSVTHTPRAPAATSFLGMSTAKVVGDALSAADELKAMSGEVYDLGEDFLGRDARVESENAVQMLKYYIYGRPKKNRGFGEKTNEVIALNSVGMTDKPFPKEFTQG